jgi:hypothetical protein
VPTGIYAGLGTFFTTLLFFRMLSQLLLCLWTAKLLHESVLVSILRAPMSFFDTTPVGRILNRFRFQLNTTALEVPIYKNFQTWMFLFSFFVSTKNALFQ